MVRAALERDNVVVVGELLGGQPSRSWGDGLTPLHCAASCGALRSAGFLLQAGADPNCWDAAGELTPLHSAAANTANTREMLELLVNNGGNINNGLERNGGSVLHSAVRENNLDMVRYLLDNKVETIVRTFYETALHTAAEHDHHQVAELLLQFNPAGANALRHQTERLTPLHIVADSGHTAACRVLLRAGADVSLLTGQSMSAVHLVSECTGFL